MSTVRKDINSFNFQEITKDFLAMPFSELEKIHQELERIMRRKKSPDFEKKEKELIDKIKNGGPGEEFWAEFDMFAVKSDNHLITDEENKKFLSLIQINQEWAVERAKLIIELGKHWKISPKEVMNQLQIKPRSTPHA